MYCSKCKLEKNYNDFRPSIIKIGRGQCKSCMNEVQQKRRLATNNSKKIGNITIIR